MDVVVTLPLSFGLDCWIAEGDPAGEPWSGQSWDWYLGGLRPDILPGQWVYVVFNRALRGRARLVEVRDDLWERWRFSLVRHGDAEAVTITQEIQGFRGWRYRWWKYEDEKPFSNWKDPNACIGFERQTKQPPTPRTAKTSYSGPSLWTPAVENLIYGSPKTNAVASLPVLQPFHQYSQRKGRLRR